MDGLYFISGAGSLIMFLIVLAYMSSTAGNLRKIRDESKTQTRLLEQIARQTKPPGEKTSVAETSHHYLKEGGGGGALTFVTIMGVVLILLFLVALFSKH